MKLSVIDTTGRALREIDAADEVFGIEPHKSVLHQAYVMQMANRRAGGANTKRRGEIGGSTVKTRRQKGLGRSRQGSIRASHHVGGGVAMGPKPRDFGREMPRTMKRLALRSALSSHAAGGSIMVVDGIVPGEPKTKLVQEALAGIGATRAALIVSGKYEPNLAQAGRNVSIAKVVPAANLNVVDILNAHTLVMTEDAVRECEALWGGANVKPARGRRQEEAV